MTAVVGAGGAGAAPATDALVARAQDGDQGAFALLVKRHQRPVFWLQMHPRALRGAPIRMVQAAQDRHRVD